MAFGKVKGVGHKVDCNQLAQTLNIPAFESFVEIDYDEEYKELVKLLLSSNNNILPHIERTCHMIGDKIRQIRIKKTLSESEVARRSGHSVSTIHGIESGDNNNPSFKTICDIAKVLKIPLSELDESTIK